MFKNINPIWLLLGLGGAGFAVYWFALRPPDDCIDCGNDESVLSKYQEPVLSKYQEPVLSKYQEPVNSKFRSPSSPAKIAESIL